MPQKRISCHKCNSDFDNWNYGKRGRPPKLCGGCKASTRSRTRSSERPRARRRRKPSVEIQAVIDLRQHTLKVGIDNDEKQAARDKLTAQCRGQLDRYEPVPECAQRVFSLAGALYPGWRSQWDNPRSTENILTTEYPDLEWLCANKDAEVFYNIPPEHRYGDRPQDIAKIFGVERQGLDGFDIINLDLTCRFELAMDYVELILRNGWLWETGLLAVWFDNDRRCLPRNIQFLKRHKTGFRGYLGNLLLKYGYHHMAKQGVTVEEYKQYNKSSKSDTMILLMVNAARPALKNAYEMM